MLKGVCVEVQGDGATVRMLNGGDGEEGNDSFIGGVVCMRPVQVEGRHSVRVDTETTMRGSPSLFSFHFFLFSAHLLFTVKLL